MKLQELSSGYLTAGYLLRDRMSLLRRRLRQSEDAQDRASLRPRLAVLSQMQRQCYELAELTAHYYERSYYRNERYTL